VATNVQKGIDSVLICGDVHHLAQIPGRILNVSILVIH
jgi:hypothetical protein